MNKPTLSDLDVNNHVRRVFVRHQIDLGWLSFHTCRGYVYIQGALQKLPGVTDELTPSLVGALFAEIELCAGVCGLSVDLRNWKRNGSIGEWQPVKGVQPQHAMSSGEPITFIIE